jgi:uncharacterized protein YcfL
MRALGFLGLMLAALIAVGCSHSPPRVDCDKHLVPINPVTPVAKHAAERSGSEP